MNGDVSGCNGYGFIMSTVLLQPNPSAVLESYSALVVAKESFGVGNTLLTLQLSLGQYHNKTASLVAGQFVMVSLPEVMGIRFKRPFSPFLFDEATQRLTLLIKSVGEGTTALASVAVGQRLSVTAPHGNALRLEALNPADMVMIAGGVGVAPWVFLAQQLREQNKGSKALILLYGGRTQADMAPLLPLIDANFAENRVYLATNDGTQGTVIDLLASEVLQQVILERSVVLLCGPMPMMRACVAWFKAHYPQKTVVVSLENHMPCGTGSCYGCVVPNAQTPTAPWMVCTQGALFEANQLVWEEEGVAHG
jgi:dihydroorotate dehydrogenase electron transfer subunit